MKRWPLLLVVLLLALFPLVAGEYFVNLGSQVLIAVVFASSLNLLVGHGGLTSLGHASFLGVSAYVSAWLAVKMGLGHAATAPTALLVTTLIGMVFGWISLRATGLGFMMLTLALSQVLCGDQRRQRHLGADTAASLRLEPGCQQQFFLVRAAGHLRGDVLHGALDPFAVRRQPARHPRPAAPHERAGLQRVGHPLGDLRGVEFFCRRGRAAVRLLP
jgi:hypothetical protein